MDNSNQGVNKKKETEKFTIAEIQKYYTETTEKLKN